MIALFNQSEGKSLEYLNPALYQNGESGEAFHDITSGNNGDYSAAAGIGTVYRLGQSEWSGIVASAEWSQSGSHSKAASQITKTEAAPETVTSNSGCPRSRDFRDLRVLT